MIDERDLMAQINCSWEVYISAMDHCHNFKRHHHRRHPQPTRYPHLPAAHLVSLLGAYPSLNFRSSPFERGEHLCLAWRS